MEPGGQQQGRSICPVKKVIFCVGVAILGGIPATFSLELSMIRNCLHILCLTCVGMLCLPILVDAKPHSKSKNPPKKTIQKKKSKKSKKPPKKKSKKKRLSYKWRGLDHDISLWPGEDFPLSPTLRRISFLSKKVNKQGLRRLRLGRESEAFAIWYKGTKALRGVRKLLARFDMAHMAMSIGDADRAIALYRWVVKQNKPRTSLISRVIVARYLSLRFECKKALRWLGKLSKQPTPRLSRYWSAAWFLRGRCQENIGQLTKARASYQLLAAKVPPLKDILAYRALRILLRQKKHATLLKEFPLYLRRYPKSRYVVNVRKLYLRTLEKQKQYKKALGLYKFYLKRRRGLSKRWLLRRLARLYRQRKQEKKARRIWWNLLRGYPGSYEASVSMRQLKGSTYAKTRAWLYFTGIHAARRGKHAVAVQILRMWLPKEIVRWKPKDVGVLPWTLRETQKKKKVVVLAKRYSKLMERQIERVVYLLGKSLFRLDKYKEACQLMAWFVVHRPKSRIVPAVSLYWTRSYYRWKKDLKSISYYAAFWRDFPKDRRAPRSLWWAAQLYGEVGKDALSLSYFRRYARRYPQKRRSDEALIKMALVHYQKKRFKKAILILRRATMRRRIAARAWFWLGKSYEQLKQPKKAHRCFDQISLIGDSYYYARAQSRLKKGGVLASTPVSLFALLEDEAMAALSKKKIFGWFLKKGGNKAKWSKLRRQLVNHPVYQRAYILGLAGEFTEVSRAFRSLRRGHPLRSYFLARAWLGFGEAYRAIHEGARFRRKLRGKLRRGFPYKAILRLQFPVPFPFLYMRYGRKYGVRPMLLLGITRQESMFNPRIVSHAGAVGIAQIMPKEGRKMARKFGVRPFKVAYLKRPRLNLRMGFYHFAAYLKKHQNSVELTLAAYNAGPKPLSRWKKQFHQLAASDLEAFIEIGIGYRETRRYVPFCLRWYNLYRFHFLHSSVRS